MDIIEAAGLAGLNPKKMATTRGGEFRSACPYCGGDGQSDRFLCWPADKGGRGAFWCRGCRVAGDTVQLLVDKCGYQYRDAFKAVGQDMPANYRPAGYNAVSTSCEKQKFEPRVYENPVEIWQEKAQKFIDAAHKALLENDETLNYLAGRGLDLKAVKAFRLGWFGGEKNNNCMFRSRTAWGLSKIKNEKTGRDKMLWIPRGIVIPCFKGGKIYRVRIRRAKEDLQKKTDIKYYALPGSGQEVMGHNPEHKAFVVIEAELDEMMVTRRAGSIVGTVGLGSAAIKPGSSVFYILQKAVRVLVALDYDKAGQAAWKWWKDNFDNARRWPVPAGKDPGEAFQAGVDIKEWVRAGLPPVLTMEKSKSYKIPEGMYPIEELQMLLEKYPVKLRAEPDHAQIIFDPGFKNFAIRQRIKDLFYGDDEVHWYLRIHHPASIITGDNFKMKKTA
ncbi:MAG: alpha helicase [Desulfobacteraceae bacterium]|nr:alpha helicase [Desulfobacteraceae bacterium]